MKILKQNLPDRIVAWTQNYFPTTVECHIEPNSRGAASLRTEKRTQVVVHPVVSNFLAEMNQCTKRISIWQQARAFDSLCVDLWPAKLIAASNRLCSTWFSLVERRYTFEVSFHLSSILKLQKDGIYSICSKPYVQAYLEHHLYFLFQVQLGISRFEDWIFAMPNSFGIHLNWNCQSNDQFWLWDLANQEFGQFEWDVGSHHFELLPNRSKRHCMPNWNEI